MSASTRPVPSNAVAALLDGLSANQNLESLAAEVEPFFGFGGATSPRVLLEVAASAFLACGALSADPLVFDDLARQYLADCPDTWEHGMPEATVCVASSD